MARYSASRSATSTRWPPLRNVGSGGRSLRFRWARNIRRSADSTSSDIVRPCRAASRLRRAMTESSIFSVVFIWKTIPQRWLYVKNQRMLGSASASGSRRRDRRIGRGACVATPLIGEHGLDVTLERGDGPLNDTLDNLDIYTEVLVDQYIPQGGDAPPRNFGMPTLQRRREILDRFADHLQITDDSILNHRVAEESVASLDRVLLDAVDSIPDVTQVDGCVLHKGLASARTPSRRYGLRAASVRTSTQRPRRSSTSSLKAIRSSRSRSGARSTRRSRSLAALASPRARDPNTRTRTTPCAAARRRISVDCCIRSIGTIAHP